MNTRPKWKAYLVLVPEFIKNNQEKAALVLGYFLVALLFFNLGKFLGHEQPPDVKIEEPTIDLTEVYNNLKSSPNQLISGSQGAEVAGAISDDLNCDGKIKGNIGSSGKIYHLPGGAFYSRTIPELCFSTEAEAQAAGFRQSSR